MQKAVAVLFALLFVGVWSVQLAAACSTSPLEPFAIDPALRASDMEAPAAFRDVQSSTRQISGTRCNGKTCTSSSCGDSGLVTLTFAAPEEDAGQLGYRVLWLRGNMPDELRATLAQTWPLRDTRTIQIGLSFQGVTQLDGELALVAVDRAGNESAQSAPVPVRFGGCMSYFDDPTCEHPATCSALHAAQSGMSRGAIWLPLAAAAALFIMRRRLARD